MKKVLLAFAGFFAIFAAFYFLQNTFKEDFGFFTKSNTATATINGQTFNLKVAKTEEDRVKGLSGTNSLPADQGMLFVFDNLGYYPFWMKNMNFPIDIIYLNKDTIVTIIKNAPLPKENENPTVYNPTKESDRVLEINAGLSDKYNFKIGDKINIQSI